MKKKLLTIMILGCMAVSLVACGGNKNADTNNSNQAGQETDKESNKKEPGILKSKTEKPEGAWIQYYEYDKNGYEITNKTIHHEEGYIISHVEKVYDENGNLLSYNPIMTSGYEVWMGYEYDEHGNVTQEFYFTENGEKGDIEREYINEYDEHGNLISRTTVAKYSYGDEIKDIYTTEITYDENGRKTFALERRTNGEKNREFEWSYYADGTLKQDISRFCYGDYYISVVTTDYDEQGRVIKIKNGDDVQEWSYDEAGNVLSEKTYNDEENDYFEYAYTYDADGKLLKIETFRSRGGSVASTKTYEYNENGRLEKIVDGNIFITFDYDENDNIIKEYRQTEDGVFCVVEYTYYE